jgi:nucleoside-diphosphate-sugar epimerase
MNVLVTGAAGHLGSHTCQALQAAGIKFRATDACTSRSLPFKVVVANLLDRENCYSLIEGCDVVVHLGNHPNEQAADAQRIFSENCAMNVNIFQASMELGVRKIVFASSIQAMAQRRYGECETVASRLPYLPADGDIPGRPGNHYSVSKIAAEQFLRYMVDYQHLTSAVAIRFPGMLQSDWYVHVRQHTDPTRIWKNANVDEAFTWLSFPDAGRLLAAVLKAELPGYRCYLPAHPSPLIDMLPQAIIARFFKGVPLKKPLDQIASLVDISRITADTGWVPQDDFRKDPAPVK